MELANENIGRRIKINQAADASAFALLEGSKITVCLKSEIANFELCAGGEDIKLVAPSNLLSNTRVVSSDYLGHILASLEAVFVSYPLRDRVEVLLPDSLSALLCELGVAARQNEKCLVAAAAFWQLSLLWCSRGVVDSYPLYYLGANGQKVPTRPARAAGTVYARYIPWLDKVLSFKVVDADQDLEQINRWMNDPRVSFFWEEEGDMEYHRAFVEKRMSDSRVIPLIGFFDAHAFGYFEVYWAKEDRLAPFCNATDFDRGFHLLVGEETFRGRQWLEAWYPSLLHFMFLDDVRTQRVMAEPRADNFRLLRCSEMLGFEKIKEFDFPHKRAVLLSMSRASFFGNAQQLAGCRM